MTVREYIGARYVPLFMGEWDNTESYEPLSIVTYQGDSYTSRQAVPIGIPITNTAYWVVTGNYNAQVEQYRQEVSELAGIIPDTDFSSTNTVKDYIDNTIGTIGDDVEALEDMLPVSAFSNENTVKDYVDDLGAILPASDFSDVNTVKDYIDTLAEKGIKVGLIRPITLFPFPYESFANAAEMPSVKQFVDFEISALYLR